MHRATGDFKVSIDFAKRDRLLKKAMLMDHMSGTSRRLGKFPTLNIMEFTKKAVSNLYHESRRDLLERQPSKQKINYLEEVK